MTQITRRTVLASLALSPAFASAASAEGAHGFSFTSIEGSPLPLADFAGRTVLIANTASRCAFTYQYDALQALYDRYRAQGVVVLGVPSDDFGGQELATEAEVKQFCAVNFAIDFPMTEITHVRGPKAHPFYAWARETLGPGKAPRWNFHKYLIAPDGTLVDGFSHAVEPDAPQIRRAIEGTLSV